MKRISRGEEPGSLIRYRNKFPMHSWDQMKGNNLDKGDEAYSDCREGLIQSQGGVCAYCEIDIRDNDSLKCRVEHFHPKSDNSPQHNWALDWDNMLGVCAGGSYRYGLAPYSMEPLIENLSCDAHKDRLIQSNKFPEHCEGFLLDPAFLPGSPRLFEIEKSTGRIFPSPACKDLIVPEIKNNYSCIHGILEETIEVLNLNCDRLCQARLAVVRNIEHNKKKQREAGFDAKQGLANLVQHYFRQQWPGFFTTIRACLGDAADQYLAANNYP